MSISLSLSDNIIYLIYVPLAPNKYHTQPNTTEHSECHIIQRLGTSNSTRQFILSFILNLVVSNYIVQ